MNVKNYVNYIGTPLLGIAVGYTVGGEVGAIGGLIASYLPDLPYIKMMSEDLIKGRNENRLKGLTLQLRDYTHSLLGCTSALALSAFGVIPNYIGVIWTSHIVIDYLTHDKEAEYFEPFKPLYPYKNIEIP